MASNLRRSKRTVGKRISDLQSRVSYLQKRPAPRRIGNRVIRGTQLVPGAVTRDELALPVTQTLDGKNSIYRQPTEPTGGTYVVGDCWYDTDDGYKLYIYTATSETTFAWVLSQDAGINEAQLTADGKNKVYRQISMPVGGVYAINDLWFDTDDGNKVYGWTGTAWASLVDAGIAAGIAAANAAQVTADGRNRIYRQTTAPTGGVYVPGDLWFDTDDGNKVYGWTGTAWASLVDAGIAAGIAAANAAQATANGRNRIFRQATAPTGETYAEGDLWFDTDDDNRFYRYVSGIWSGFLVGNNAIATLSANKLTAGTIDASVITVSNLDAGNITAGTIAAARITTASIAAAEINASKIVTGTLNASVVTVSNLDAGNITTGTFTAGGGVELGNDVGPGTGHTGLSLSGANFNNIFLRRESDGVLFFRINENGTNSLTFDSLSGVLAVTGTITAPSGAIGGWTINSSGLRNAAGIRTVNLYPAAGFASDPVLDITYGSSRSAVSASGLTLYNDASIDCLLATDQLFLRTGYVDVSHYYMDSTATSDSVDNIVRDSSTGRLYIKTSNRDLKENILPVGNSLSTLEKLSPVSFNWKITDEDRQKDTDYKILTKQTYKSMGFILEEVLEVSPELVTWRKNKEEDGGPPQPGYWKVDDFVALAIQGIKDLSKKVTALENEISILKGSND